MNQGLQEAQYQNQQQYQMMTMQGQSFQESEYEQSPQPSFNSNNQGFYVLDQAEECEQLEVLQLSNNKTNKFSFLQFQHWFLNQMSNIYNLSDCNILTVRRKKIQFSCKKDNKVLFAAAQQLSVNFNIERKIRFDELRVLKSCADDLSVGEYQLNIRKQDIKDHVKQKIYAIQCKSSWGEKFNELIFFTLYEITKLEFVSFQNEPIAIPFTPFCSLDNSILSDERLKKHLLQKVLTLISEGELIPHLSTSTIFYNHEKKCLEIIGLYEKKNQKYQQSKDFVKGEEDTIKKLLRILQETPTRGDEKLIQTNKKYLFGESVIENIPLYTVRSACDVASLHQCPLPFLWHLYHSYTYTEIEIIEEKYIVYTPFYSQPQTSLYFYYSGQLCELNMKHHLPPLPPCYIFCFDSATHSKILKLQDELKSLKERNNDQDRITDIKKSLEQFFRKKFSTNNSIAFLGYLQNNKPHGTSKLRCFLNTNKHYQDDPIFNYEIFGYFQHGILNGEGSIWKIQIGKNKNLKTYFDNMINIGELQQTNSVDRMPSLSFIQNKWMKRESDTETFQYIFYDLNEPGFEKGKYLLHQKSIFFSKQAQNYNLKRKIFINVSCPFDSFTSDFNCKLFMRTNPLSHYETQVYILQNSIKPQFLEIELIRNIIQAFSQDFVNSQSAYISEIDLSFSHDWKQLRFASKINPSQSKIKYGGLRFELLGEQEQESILRMVEYIDISEYQSTLLELLQTEGEIIHSRNSLESSSQSQSQKQYSDHCQTLKLIAQNCNPQIDFHNSSPLLIDFKNLLKVRDNLIELNISHSKVKQNILSELPLSYQASLKKLDISHTVLEYDCLKVFFESSCQLTWISFRGIKVEKRSLYSRTELFIFILQSDVLKTIQYLDLSENDKIIKKHIPIIIGYMPDLRKIRLSKCKELEHDTHKYFYHHIESKVEYLDYSYNKVSFDYLKEGSSPYKRSLTSIDFSNCDINYSSNYFQVFLSYQKFLSKFKCNYSLISSQQFNVLQKIISNCDQIKSIHCLLSNEFVAEELQIALNSILKKTFNIFLIQSTEKNVKKKPIKISPSHTKIGTNTIRVFYQKFPLSLFKSSQVDLSLFCQPAEILKEQELIYKPTEVNNCQQSNIIIKDGSNTLNLGNLSSQYVSQIAQQLHNLPNFKNITNLICTNAGINFSQLKITQNIKKLEIRNIKKLETGNIKILEIGNIPLSNQLNFLEEITADSVTFPSNESSQMPQMSNLKFLTVKNLSLTISSMNDFKITSIILEAAKVSKKLSLSFKLKEQMTTEQEIEDFFHIFHSRNFDCQKMFCSFEGVKISDNLISNLKNQIQIAILAMIYNTTTCKKLSLILDDTYIFNLRQFFKNLPKFYISLTLKMQIDKYVIGFIKDQTNLKTLKLYSQNLQSNQNWEFLSLMQITQIIIYQDKLQPNKANHYGHFPKNSLSGEIIIKKK